MTKPQSKKKTEQDVPFYVLLVFLVSKKIITISVK